jgi:hypothetical protein
MRRRQKHGGNGAATQMQSGGNFQGGKQMVGQAEYEIVGNEVRASAGQLQPQGTLEEAANKVRELDKTARAIAFTAKDRMSAALDAAFWCGQWLCYAKSKLSHGQWLPWLDGVGIQQRTAHRYMGLASNKTDRSNLLLSARNLTHAMELAGVRRPEPTKADTSGQGKARLPDTIERIALDFARWKVNDFDKRIEGASDALLCAWERELKPMAQAYEHVKRRLTE